MAILKSGDLVMLKSGGPIMTVDTVNTDIFDDNKVTGILCAWFAGDRLERARFEQTALVPASPSGHLVQGGETSSHSGVGEYKAVLDEMVAAMNDPADAPRMSGVGIAATASEKSRRAASAGAAKGVSEPVLSPQSD
jgi:uncharacterized protein YodC (DUF2158 family)